VRPLHIRGNPDNAHDHGAIACLNELMPGVRKFVRQLSGHFFAHWNVAQPMRRQASPQQEPAFCITSPAVSVHICNNPMPLAVHPETTRSLDGAP